MKNLPNYDKFTTGLKNRKLFEIMVELLLIEKLKKNFTFKELKF